VSGGPRTPDGAPTFGPAEVREALEAARRAVTHARSRIIVWAADDPARRDQAGLVRCAADRAEDELETALARLHGGTEATR